MSELDFLAADIKELAEQLAGGPEDLADLMADAARLYRRDRFVALGLIAVDSMVTDGPEEIDEQNPRPGQACSTAIPIRNAPVPPIISRPSDRLRQAREVLSA